MRPICRSWAGLVGIVVCGAVALLVAPSAWGALRGRDGLLVVQPATGRGLVLVAASGAGERWICTERLLCGRPVRPRWSPDGSELVFDGSAGSRVGIVGAGGTCVWCALGSPSSTAHVSSASFTSSGAVVTFLSGAAGSRGALWRVGWNGSGARQLLRGPFSDAVWSSTGRLAVVRAGFVWVGTVSGLRLLARGVSPSWSPDGSRIALVHGGWVWVVRVRDRASRRLIRGNAPAWSPDSLAVAYVGARNGVYVVAAGGGHPRRVGRLRGRSRDWQPAPRSRSCTPPPSASAVARSPQAVVYSTTTHTDTPFDRISWYGCLRATGHEWLLNSALSDLSGGTDVVSLGRVALAGRFAALPFAHGGRYSYDSFSVSVYDLSTGTQRYGGLDACPGAPLVGAPCSLDSLVLNSSGFTAWHASEFPLMPSCAMSSPCATEQIYAHDDQGTRLIDSAPPGTGKSLTNVKLSGNQLTWNHDGTPH
jgi:WD40-like Beta Propeller Repeat